MQTSIGHTIPYPQKRIEGNCVANWEIILALANVAWQCGGKSAMYMSLSRLRPPTLKTQASHHKHLQNNIYCERDTQRGEHELPPWRRASGDIACAGHVVADNRVLNQPITSNTPAESFLKYSTCYFGTQWQAESSLSLLGHGFQPLATLALAPQEFAVTFAVIFAVMA